jgi:hypothetical protein
MQLNLYSRIIMIFNKYYKNYKCTFTATTPHIYMLVLQATVILKQVAVTPNLRMTTLLFYHLEIIIFPTIYRHIYFAIHIDRALLRYPLFTASAATHAGTCSTLFFRRQQQHREAKHFHRPSSMAPTGTRTHSAHTRS